MAVRKVNWELARIDAAQRPRLPHVLDGELSQIPRSLRGEVPPQVPRSMRGVLCGAVLVGSGPAKACSDDRADLARTAPARG